MNDTYPNTGKTLYLNIIWHQHQPLYLDPESDQLQGPWVRTHGTKDYYDMAAILEKYPKIHFTVNLTSSLLLQLQVYYVERLAPFVDVKKNRVDAKKFFIQFAGKTDPWIDLALKPTGQFNERDLKFLFTNSWNAFGVSEIVITRFPEYKLLKEKYAQGGVKGMSQQDIREVKYWFYLALFDPDFLERPQKLATGATIDLTDIIQKNMDGTYTLKKKVTEEECNRIIAETYKVLSAIVPIHKKLMYHPAKYKGQIEVLTTPYYHPILPLIYDSDLAILSQPSHTMPARYHFPKDAEAQVAKAVQAYKKTFGMNPTGMWPGEGSLAFDVIPVFAHQGIKWIATDQKILERSKPGAQPCFYPYAVFPEHSVKAKDAVVVVFRETELSDKIGFVYKNYLGEDAAEDFIQGVLKYVPKDGEPDRLLTVILDGENAWEWYKYDNDGKNFQNALYRKLTALFETRQVITTTVTEYINGNPKRMVSAHPVETLQRIEWLWPGSWINANYDTWIGQNEKNKAWEYLSLARNDLEASGLPQPHPKKRPPREKTKAWYAFRAWESMYAAEGSDWFWWYGTDQNTPAGEKPFDLAYITHLQKIYKFAELAGGKMPKREFKPIVSMSTSNDERHSQGTMAQSQSDLVTVVFQCDARGMYVRTSLYLVGNHEELGNWIPNKVRLYDDGNYGDKVIGDNIWTIELALPVGIEIEYKFTNSGAEGNWNPGEEFPGINRKIRVERTEAGKMLLLDVFGKI
jgi:alpha-amylase/alpha-mannosidase (GH57 family)